jgi:acyl carrier protein
MLDRESRLIRCFEAVFPGLTPDEIRASGAEHGMWDSLSLVTLVAVVQEEFGLEIAPDELANLDSFSAFGAYLELRQAAGKSTQEL